MQHEVLHKKQKHHMQSLPFKKHLIRICKQKVLYTIYIIIIAVTALYGWTVGTPIYRMKTFIKNKFFFIYFNIP